MPNIALQVVFPVLDAKRYLTDLRKAIRDTIIAASQKFLEAAIPRIPVWTGMARGALENLEVFAGVTLPFAAPRATSGYYYYPGRLPRTPELGQSLATPPNQILNAEVITAETTVKLHFQFRVDINYFDILDENWGAFAAGEEAFNIALRDELDKRVPYIRNYFNKKRFV